MYVVPGRGHHRLRLFWIEGDPERHFKFEFSVWHVDAEDWFSFYAFLRMSQQSKLRYPLNF
jgi:hypothetical protein